MKTAGQLTAGKLRGGFYSPPGLVRVCLDRIAALIPGQEALRLLEPSAGDGAFIRGLAGHPLAARTGHLTAVEVDAAEAAKCRSALAQAPFTGEVIGASVLNGARALLGRYHAAAGNPPFVRFQFRDPADRAGVAAVAAESGVPLGGVANLWIPVLLTALTRLIRGGAFAFIVPAECFTGISAGSVRAWLAGSTESLQADLFQPGSFPAVLQEVIVLSGRTRHGGPPRQPLSLRVTEHTGGGARSWLHELTEPAPTWTRYLLGPAQLAAVRAAAELPQFRRFSAVGRLRVATVTGANDYFSVDDATLARYELRPWALPLLPRIRHASGLVFTGPDHRALTPPRRRWLLSFAEGLPSPQASPAARRYLRQGEASGLPARYKCRIRAPWYRVPVVAPGRLLMSKRSHRFPRLVLNAAGALTTDTIYQGGLTGDFAGREAGLVAGFHNSVTLLTAEIEGRSFGGGVLELVPTEIGRLLVPVVTGLRSSLPALDSRVRAAGADTEKLVAETDRLLAGCVPGLTAGLLATVREARAALLQRRLDRAG